MRSGALCVLALRRGRPSMPSLSHRIARMRSRNCRRNSRWNRKTIGYGKPPLHSRFQKGRFGNPASRPLAPQSLRKSLLKLLEEKVSIRKNGRTERFTRLQLIFKQVINKAARGEVRFYKLLLEYAPLMDFNLRRRPVAPRDPDIWAQEVVKHVYHELTKDRLSWLSN
jgi:Family of unknown function (DUF5681)